MEQITQIAKVTHEVNRGYCASIGDTSQPRWEDCPEWQRQSAINGVEAHLKSDLSPEESHELWMKDKIDNGWVYGKEKDTDRKTHPCLVKYEDLPLEQKVKDYLFKAVVGSFKG